MNTSELESIKKWASDLSEALINACLKHEDCDNCFFLPACMSEYQDWVKNSRKSILESTTTQMLSKKKSEKNLDIF